MVKEKLHNLFSDKNFSEILIGSAWAFASQVIASVLGMVTSIIIARIYSAEILGIVTVLQSFLMLTTIFTVFGTNTSILRLIPEYLAKYSISSAFQLYRKIYYFVSGMSIATGSLLFFAADFVADKIFSKPHLRFYFAMGAVFIIFKSLMILTTEAVRGLRLIRLFAFLQLLPNFSNIIILISITMLFFHQGNPIYALLSSTAITAIAGSLIVNRVFQQKCDSADKLHPIPMKKILTLSFPMFMTATITFVIGQTGVIMLGIFRSEAEVGYYAIAMQLAGVTSFILSAINSIAAPKFSELYHSGNIEDLFYVAKKSAKLIFYITSPILLFLILLGNYFIPLLYGPGFIAAYLAMVFLTIGQFTDAACGSTGIFMNMTGHHKALLYIKLTAALINIVLCVLLIPYYGLYGAGFSAMISLSFWNITALLYIKLIYGKFIGYAPLIHRY